jgi:hypothetical protein
MPFQPAEKDVLTLEDEQALAEYTQSGEMEHCLEDGLLGGAYRQVIQRPTVTGENRIYGVSLNGGQLVRLGYEDIATMYGKSFGQPESGEVLPEDRVRPPGYRAPAEPNESDEIMAQIREEARLHEEATGQATWTVRTSGASPQLSVADSPDQPRPVAAPDWRANLGGAAPTPTGEFSFSRREPSSHNQANDEELDELSRARMAYVMVEAEQARGTLTVDNNHPSKLWESYEELREQWLDKEWRKLSGLGVPDEEVEGIIQRLEHQEDWLATQQYGQAMHLAGGYYKLEEAEGLAADHVVGGKGVVERQSAESLGKFERFARWYGDTSGTKRERAGRLLGKVAIVGGGGLAVGLVAAATVGGLVAVAPAAAVAVGVRVGKSSLLAKVNSKVRDMHVTQRATATTEKLTAKIEYTGDSRGLQQRRFGQPKTEDRSMYELIHDETMKNVWRNRGRLIFMGATATGGALIPVAAEPVANFLKEHNPFNGWSIDWFGSGERGGVTHEGSGQPTPTHEPTPSPNPEPTPGPQQPGGGNGGGNHGGNGNHHEHHGKPKQFELQKGHTIWDDTNDYIEQRGGHLTPAEHRRLVGQILWQNHETWASARRLPVGYDWHIGQQLLQHALEEEEDAA